MSQPAKKTGVPFREYDQTDRGHFADAIFLCNENNEQLFREGRESS